MTDDSKIEIVDIDKLVNPWGGDEQVAQEVRDYLKKDPGNPESFNCKRCNIVFQPAPYKPIYYNLCDNCFKEFDAQKMAGRYAYVKDKSKGITHIENVDEWIKSTKR